MKIDKNLSQIIYTASFLEASHLKSLNNQDRKLLDKVCTIVRERLDTTEVLSDPTKLNQLHEKLKKREIAPKKCCCGLFSVISSFFKFIANRLCRISSESLFLKVKRTMQDRFDVPGLTMSYKEMVDTSTALMTVNDLNDETFKNALDNVETFYLLAVNCANDEKRFFYRFTPKTAYNHFKDQARQIKDKDTKAAPYLVAEAFKYAQDYQKLTEFFEIMAMQTTKKALVENLVDFIHNLKMTPKPQRQFDFAPNGWMDGALEDFLPKDVLKAPLNHRNPEYLEQLKNKLAENDVLYVPLDQYFWDLGFYYAEYKETSDDKPVNPKDFKKFLQQLNIKEKFVLDHAQQVHQINELDVESQINRLLEMGLLGHAEPKAPRLEPQFQPNYGFNQPLFNPPQIQPYLGFPNNPLRHIQPVEENDEQVQPGEKFPLAKLEMLPLSPTGYPIGLSAPQSSIETFDLFGRPSFQAFHKPKNPTPENLDYWNACNQMLIDLKNSNSHNTDFFEQVLTQFYYAAIVYLDDMVYKMENGGYNFGKINLIIHTEYLQNKKLMDGYVRNQITAGLKLLVETYQKAKTANNLKHFFDGIKYHGPCFAAKMTALTTYVEQNYADFTAPHIPTIDPEVSINTNVSAFYIGFKEDILIKYCAKHNIIRGMDWDVKKEEILNTNEVAESLNAQNFFKFLMESTDILKGLAICKDEADGIMIDHDIKLTKDRLLNFIKSWVKMDLISPANKIEIENLPALETNESKEQNIQNFIKFFEQEVIRDPKNFGKPIDQIFNKKTVFDFLTETVGILYLTDFDFSIDDIYQAMTELNVPSFSYKGLKANSGLPASENINKYLVSFEQKQREAFKQVNQRAEQIYQQELRRNYYAKKNEAKWESFYNRKEFFIFLTQEIDIFHSQDIRFTQDEVQAAVDQLIQQ